MKIIFDDKSSIELNNNNSTVTGIKAHIVYHEINKALFKIKDNMRESLRGYLLLELANRLKAEVIR